MSGRESNIVGIFSRSSKEDYSWLVELLTSEYFRKTIREVRPCYISNSGFQQFMNNLSQCTFGILYHTKNRGRINITNVNGSLYDEELEYLNKTLGKDGVIVLIDDLKDSSDCMKIQILENQPSVGKWASDLLLISHTEKADRIQLVRKLKSIKQLCHPSDYRTPFSNIDTPDQDRQVYPPTSYPEHTKEKPYDKEHPHKVDLVPQTSKTLNTCSQKTSASWKSIIGIFSVSEEDHISWLGRLLSLNTFGQREVTYHKMPSYDKVGLEEGNLQCGVAILYHTMKTGKVVTSQMEFLYHKVTDQLVQKLGKDNVIVLIDDLKSYTDKKWAVFIQSKIERWAGDLLYFLEEEKLNQQLLVQRLKSLKLFRQPPEYHPKADPIQPTSGTLNTISAPASAVIGVFSCSEKSKFSWLERLLSSEDFGNHQVIFHQIFPGNMSGFQSRVSHCKFGILYHSMDRGYKPLTDLGNSLYDEELKYLSTTLGKNRVIVVMDEVGNSGEEAKSWTLENQPSLGMLARDVLLFSKYERKRNRSVPADRNLVTLYEKLNTLKEILKEGMTSTSFSS